MKHVFLLIIVIGLILWIYYTIVWFNELNAKIDTINDYVIDLQENWIDVYIR